MRVLIVSVTAGQGHHAAAAALREELADRGAEVFVLDVLKHVSEALYHTVDKGYLLSAKHGQYRRLYEALEGDGFIRKTAMSVIKNGYILGRLRKHVMRLKPDVIVSTHPYAAKLIDELRGRGFINSEHLGINTDYTLLPFWETLKHLEGLVLCGTQLISRAVSRGINPGILLPLGIPVQKKYYSCLPREEALERLGLSKDKKTVLIMSGSMGYGSLVKTAERLARSGLDIQIICICGRNREVYNKLIHQEFPVKLLVLGYVNNVHECMDAADIIVTKPGGLSVSESLSKKKPLILIQPIPGHEEDNLTLLVNYGLAMYATKSMPVYELVGLLFTCPDRLRHMQNAIDTYACGESTFKICDHIEKMAEKDR